MNAYWVSDNYKVTSDIELIYLFLSVRLWKKFNPTDTTILYVDEDNYDYYHKMGLWDEIKIFEFDNSIDKRSNSFWAAGKLEAMKDFQTPFVIMDLDMFYTDKIHLDNVDVIPAYKENGHGYYFDEHNEVIRKSGIKPFLRTQDAFNVSFLHIKDEDFKNEYVETALDWIHKINNIKNVSGGHMTFCEQKLLYDLVISKDVSHSTLLDKEWVCKTDKWKSDGSESDKNYFHLGPKKRSLESSKTLLLKEKGKVLKTISDKFPELTKECFLFLKNVNSGKEHPYTLRGNFDLLLTGACTMSCKGCSYLDYKDMGCTIGGTLRMDDLKSIVDNLLRLNLRLDTLTLLGGEPTLHPDYLDFIKYLHQYKGVVYTTLRVITNGTFLKEDFIESLDYLDVVRFSIYPNNSEIETHLHDSGLYDYIESKCYIVVLRHNTFYKYGEEQDGLEYSQQLNWDRCWAKDRCRPITVDGIYRCYITYNHGEEICDYSDRQNLIEYINNDSDPLDMCKTCPMPCKEVPWESNNDNRDIKLVNNGVKFIREWKNHI